MAEATQLQRFLAEVDAGLAAPPADLAEHSTWYALAAASDPQRRLRCLDLVTSRDADAAGSADRSATAVVDWLTVDPDRRVRTAAIRRAGFPPGAADASRVGWTAYELVMLLTRHAQYADDFTEDGLWIPLGEPAWDSPRWQALRPLLFERVLTGPSGAARLAVAQLLPLTEDDALSLARRNPPEMRRVLAERSENLAVLDTLARDHDRPTRELASIRLVPIRLAVLAQAGPEAPVGHAPSDITAGQLGCRGAVANGEDGRDSPGLLTRAHQ